MANKHAKEKKFAPSVDKLDTTAVLAATKRNAQTVQVITLPLVRSVQNGYLKKSAKIKSRKQHFFRRGSQGCRR